MTLHDVLATHAFAEPHPAVSRPRAFTVLALLVETLAGFACGALGKRADHPGDPRPMHSVSLTGELAARLRARLPREPVDDVVAARFTRELRAGWSAYLAAIGDRRGAPPDSAMWLEWTRRVHGEREPARVRPYIAAIH